MVFHQTLLGCSRCHAVTDDPDAVSLGPNLALIGDRSGVTDIDLITSVLKPSDAIRKGYETLTVVRTDGTVVTGLKGEPTGTGAVMVREASTNEVIRVPAAEVDQVVSGTQSIMPQGVVNRLGGRQQFLDLMRYLIEIRDGGPARAAELQPPASLIAFRVPDYESHIDHAGLLRSLDDGAFERGEAVYSRLCINCHGTRETPGSLPTALRFGQGRFRNGSDPFAMYQTLTHGFGLMTPQTWMVPRQKYDVIHYIREEFLRPHNPAQYFALNDAYVAGLPEGDTFGPEPAPYSPWSDMNYGPWMFNTIEVSRDGSNIAYKGLAVRLDPGPGGVSRGNQWLLFDHDTMRMAGTWSHDPEAETRFIDWQGIHFDGRHQAHPHAVGRLLAANPTGPGWADPETDSFEDDQRVVGRDGRRYGPLPESWSTWHGLYHAGESVVVSYSVGDRRVLESFSATPPGDGDPVVARHLHLAPSASANTLLVATAEVSDPSLRHVSPRVVAFGRADSSSSDDSDRSAAELEIRNGRFDGSGWLETADTADFNMATHDFTITARIRTEHDGVIVCQTEPGPEWVPNGTVLFVRGGRLCYDIGWVGVIRSRQAIDDGQWHDIALVWSHADQRVRLVVDGRVSGSGELGPRERLDNAVLRIGYGAPDFPDPTAFRGAIRDVAFYDRALEPQQIPGRDGSPIAPIARWLGESPGDEPDAVPLTVQRSAVSNTTRPAEILAGLAGDASDCRFEVRGQRLCLRIPPSSEPRRLTLWMTATAADTATATERAASIRDTMDARHAARTPLNKLIQQPARPLWPEQLKTIARRGTQDDSGFAIDTLTAPDPNPWLARLRFGGHDFCPDGQRMIVCAWDGDVWEVSGLDQLNQTDTPPELTWRRIASGLFQPLGVKIVEGDIYLTCRDQIVILRDRNGDGATDFYECFNNDQQVTEHFHEFAMGLQRDDQGRFYYAKSARHALEALVPQHGTLLRVSPDGSQTDILAVGFRAANGVCLNPDGTFIVTDQEGHWNPKNRINWVHEGGFYGNMYGYHDITDSSDEAMEPPLCWITNSFDRSPAELLWADSRRWGNLQGVLLNLSYGYGKVYTVPHEHRPGTGRVQGGMCALPIPQFPTGTMRGRFHPVDGQLYVCGLFAWASSQQAREGGLYRIRYAGRGAVAPTAVQVDGTTLSVTFSDPLDAEASGDPGRFAFRVWSLRRTANYGSKHYDERVLDVTSATVSEDGRTLMLTIPELEPTWCYELQCRLRTADGRSMTRVIHGTIHQTE